MKTITDKEMVLGLINQDPAIKRIFLNKYRELVFRMFTAVKEKLKLNTPLTEQMKEEYLHELWENFKLGEKKWKEAISDGRSFDLSQELVVKLNYFCRDKLLVRALKSRDERVTYLVFYGDDPLISFQPKIKTFLNKNEILDLETNKPMSSTEVASQLYDLLMKQLDRDKFHFVSSLKTYFEKSILKTYLHNYIEQAKKKRLNVNYDEFEKRMSEFYDDEDNAYSIDSDSTISWGGFCTMEFETKERHEYMERLFDTLLNEGVSSRDVNVLRNKYFDDMSNIEIAKQWHITPNNVAQIIHKHTPKIIKVFNKHRYEV